MAANHMSIITCFVKLEKVTKVTGICNAAMRKVMRLSISISDGCRIFLQFYTPFASLNTSILSML
jgi:hypothetical protein